MKEDRQMNKTTINHGKIVLLVALTLILLSSLLTSCSWFSKETKPVVTAVVTPPPPAIEPDLPYREVNFNYPVSKVINPKIYVYKTKRRLLVVENDILIREFRIGLGPRPAGDKQQQGDGRTPEGEFYVCVKKPNSAFYKSLGLSYPAPRHAERALVAGNISHEQFARIVHAIENKSRPPWDTKLGGQIFIHGGGAEADWTRGCVAMYNSSMDELFEMVHLGTTVTVLP
jgi:murein L,D-transpeptidase YafK